MNWGWSARRRVLFILTLREDHAQSWPRVVVLTEILFSYIPNKVAINIDTDHCGYIYESHSGYKESAVAALRRGRRRTDYTLHIHVAVGDGSGVSPKRLYGGLRDTVAESAV